MTWILLVLLYGLLKGAREIAKKKAMETNSVMEVLVVYTLLSFLFVIPQAPEAGGVTAQQLAFIALKSFVIFLAWICSFRSLKKLPVSLFGILDLSRVLFATFFGAVILGEDMGPWQVAGLIVVCAGLVMLKFRPRKAGNAQKADGALTADPAPAQETAPATTLYVILALLSCMLNAVSGFLDKVLMKDITSAQLQFWYMLFLISFYLIYVLVTREKIRSSVWKNWWVWLLAIMFVIGDKALFVANGYPESKITVMTLIKQSGCIVAILGGKFIFKEKNTTWRLICALVIIAGIVMGVV
ncbi:MAG: EamA family transporter [Treponema sp.]|nr:EamA family transporter [Candidatus Treponema caballi]